MSSKKFTLRELIWYGFNYMVGVTFTAVFADLVWGKNKKLADGTIEHVGVGIHLLWIMALGGLVATGCAMCFAKLSRIHNADNGAAYIYTRTQLGKFMGWAISFLQYMSMPIIVISQITSMVRINFVDPTSILYLGGVLGHATNLVLDFSGILVYMLASMVIFLGLRLFKKMVKWAVILKWSSTLFLIIAVLALLFMNLFGNETNNFNTLIKDHSHLTISLFATTFASTFFFYGGFETYITVGKNVEKPEKNIARSIIWVMLITTTFYLFITTIFMGSFGVHYAKNPNIQAFILLGGKWDLKWIGYIGTIIMLVCTISLKLQAGMQNALFSGAILEPQSREGFIPEKLGVLDEENIARKANIFNLILTAGFAIIWLLIPDAIQWLSSKHQAPFGYASITAQVGIIEMILYVTIVFICIKLAFEKKMKHHIVELVFWHFLFAFLIWQIFEFFTSIFNGINGTLNHLSAYSDDQATTYFIELIYFVLIIVASVCIYAFYYLPKYRARMIKDPEAQKKLDAEFTMTDDWAVISREIENYIDSYITRSKHVNLGYEFEYQATATKIKKIIHSSEPDITFSSRAKQALCIEEDDK